MRIGIFICALLWAGFTTSKLHSAPKVVMTAKLQETAAGRIVQRYMEAYVGKSFTFIARGSTAARQRFSGVVEQVIVPDIADYLSSGEPREADFKLKFRDVRSVRPNDESAPLSDDPVRFSMLDDFPPLFELPGHMQLIDYEPLGGHAPYPYARLLAKSQNESDETLWEALVEIKRNLQSGSQQETKEPIIVTLSTKDYWDPILEVVFPVER